MRIWRVKMWTDESPVGERYYEHYLYIDIFNKANKRSITMAFYQTYCNNDMFERPELIVEYIRKDDPIELTAGHIVDILASYHKIKNSDAARAHIFLKIKGDGLSTS